MKKTITLPQGYIIVKYETIHTIARHIEEKNYGLAEEILTDLDLHGGEEHEL